MEEEGQLETGSRCSSWSARDVQVEIILNFSLNTIPSDGAAGMGL